MFVPKLFFKLTCAVFENCKLLFSLLVATLPACAPNELDASIKLLFAATLS